MGPRICAQEYFLEMKITELQSFIETNVLGALRSFRDTTRANYYALEPGVIVEELFRTGGHSTQPLEAKVHMIWGRVYQIIFYGMDNRGCEALGEVWNTYGDRSGWDMGVMAGTTPVDASSQVFLEKFFDKVTNCAEILANGTGADAVRFDFFISGLGENEK